MSEGRPDRLGGRRADRDATPQAGEERVTGLAKLGDSDLLWPRATHVGTRAER